VLDAVKVEQPGGAGTFEVPNWDAASHKKVRDALVVLGGTIPDWRHAAGRKGEVDEVRHLIATATGWGLNPDKDAIYLNVTPARNDGTTIHALVVKDVTPRISYILNACSSGTRGRPRPTPRSTGSRSRMP
jgi:hypothetical protein